MKQKTHKSAAKRIKITRNRKMITRKQGQGHFNARSSGKVTKNKRRDVSLGGTEKAIVRKLMPFA